MKPDTTHRVTRAELLLYAATLAITLIGCYLAPPFGFALGA